MLKSCDHSLILPTKQQHDCGESDTGQRRLFPRQRLAGALCHCSAYSKQTNFTILWKKTKNKTDLMCTFRRGSHCNLGALGGFWLDKTQARKSVIELQHSSFLFFFFFSGCFQSHQECGAVCCDTPNEIHCRGIY